MGAFFAELYTRGWVAAYVVNSPAASSVGYSRYGVEVGRLLKLLHREVFVKPRAIKLLWPAWLPAPSWTPLARLRFAAATQAAIEASQPERWVCAAKELLQENGSDSEYRI